MHIESCIRLILFLGLLSLTHSRDYYFGEGIGFEIPNHWIPIDEINKKTQSEMKSLSLSLPPQLVEQIQIGRSVLFLIPGEPTLKFNVDIYEATSAYSRILEEYLEDSIRKNLEKRGFEIGEDTDIQTIPVGGVSSTYYSIPCRKDSQNFLLLAALIPCNDLYLYFHILLPVENRNPLTQDFQKLLQSFYGSGPVEVNLELWRFFFQAFLIAFLIVYLKNRSSSS